MKRDVNDTKKLFRKLGSCSRTFFYIINREFGHSEEAEERAADPLTGGILRQGYQCGMLWGASLGVGTEAFYRSGNINQAIGLAVRTTQNIVESFSKKSKNIYCYEITNCDWESKISIAKHFLTGRFLSCFKLAEEWAPEAIKAAKEGLSQQQTDLPQRPLSCASEVVKKMGGSDKETAMVAGFAGGIGLSGNACGALGAAVWKKTLDWCKKENGKDAFKYVNTEETFDKFYAETDDEIECNAITRKYFKTVDEHTEFIKCGGCKKLIDTLAQL
ncbi:MAG: C-GCAxxG-C-C family protein [Ignavibacteria bacterium]